MKMIRKNATYDTIKEEILTVLKQLGDTTDTDITDRLQHRLNILVEKPYKKENKRMDKIFETILNNTYINSYFKDINLSRRIDINEFKQHIYLTIAERHTAILNR